MLGLARLPGSHCVGRETHNRYPQRKSERRNTSLESESHPESFGFGFRNGYRRSQSVSGTILLCGRNPGFLGPVAVVRHRQILFSNHFVTGNPVSNVCAFGWPVLLTTFDNRLSLAERAPYDTRFMPVNGEAWTRSELPLLSALAIGSGQAPPDTLLNVQEQSRQDGHHRYRSWRSRQSFWAKSPAPGRCYNVKRA